MSTVTLDHIVVAIETVKGKLLTRHIKIDGETRLEDVGVDSLDTIETVLQLEDTFGRAMPDGMEAAETFGEMLRAANHELEAAE